MSTTTINIGTPVDLQKLIESRMLIQASSGGGKSYALRVLAEQVLPHMPVIILDWEGEFATLREKFDIVLVGPGGEVPCDPKSAPLLARSLIELQISAVIDMSEMKMHLRQEYVRVFLDALIGLPKKVWPSTKGKAVMVMVDEAHKLCPQKGRSVSASSVVDLTSLGRKRGLCGVLATQRLSKLDKDAAAECSNVVVGRTSNIDSARACDELGLPSTYRHTLTQVEAGDWHAVGPAFKPGLQEFRGAKAKTTHAKFGAKLLTPPAPSDKIKKVLPALEAVQNKASQEIADLQAAKKVITGLRRDLTMAKKGQAVVEVPKVVVDQDAVARALAARDKQWEVAFKAANKRGDAIWSQMAKARDAVVAAYDGGPAEGLDRHTEPPGAAPEIQPSKSTIKRVAATHQTPAASLADRINGDVSAVGQKILDSVAWWGALNVKHPNKKVVAVMAGYTVNGYFRSSLGALRTSGHIDYPGTGLVALTDAGVLIANHPTAPGTLQEVHTAWRARLSAPQRRIFDVVVEKYPHGLSTADLAEAAGYTTNGYFRSTLGSLRTLGAITKSTPATATNIVFPPGF